MKSVSSQIIIRSVPNDSMFWQVIGLTGIKNLPSIPLWIICPLIAGAY
jgi:H+/gluconate symporter-like permease